MTFKMKIKIKNDLKIVNSSPKIVEITQKSRKNRGLTIPAKIPYQENDC